MHVCHKSYHALRLFTDLLVELNPSPPLSMWYTTSCLWSPPPHSISPMIPLLPVLAGAVFGVLGLIIHFLTASSTPSPDTSWEHSRHNSLKQLYGGKYAFWSDADLTTWCCGDVTVPWAGWAGHTHMGQFLQRSRATKPSEMDWIWLAHNFGG